jgi:hypothetical protein
MAFEVELSGQKQHPCECCGNVSHTVWGYVHEEAGGTRAVYYAGWIDGHDDRVVRMTVSLGRWGDGTGADDRRSVAIDMRAPEGTPEMMVVDNALFDEPAVLGVLQRRQEALDDPALADLWAVADAIVLADPRVAEAMRWLAA